MARRVMSIGQCSFDDGAISRSLSRHFDADLVRYADGEAALEAIQAEPWDLVLVNRKLDRDGSDGMAVIRQLKAETATAGEKAVPVMLVSNFAEAQQQAEAAGAVPGFGKSDLEEDLFRERLAPWLS